MGLYRVELSRVGRDLCEFASALSGLRLPDRMVLGIDSVSDWEAGDVDILA